MSKACFDLSGRVAVVVGGTSGLGRAISIGLAEHGADVIPSGRRADAVAEVCGEIRGLGRQTLEATVDVTDRQSITQLRDAALGMTGHIDILVNAAGVTFRKPTADVSDEEWSSPFDINLEGVLHACQIGRAHV